MSPDLQGRDQADGEADLQFRYHGMAAGLRSWDGPIERVDAVPAASPRVPVSPPPGRAWRVWSLGCVVGAAVAGGVLGLPRALSSPPEVPSGEPVTAPSSPSDAAGPPLVAPIAAFGTELREIATPSPPAPVAPIAAPRPSKRRSTPPTSMSAPPPTSEVSLTRISVEGSLASLDVRAAIEPLRDRLQACHASALQRGLDIKGTMAVAMSVRGARVESIDLTAEFAPISLRSCLRDALLTAVFDAAHTYSSVRFELFLLPRRSLHP